jgi:hypothetical protein
MMLAMADEDRPTRVGVTPWVYWWVVASGSVMLALGLVGIVFSFVHQGSAAGRLVGLTTSIVFLAFGVRRFKVIGRLRTD